MTRLCPYVLLLALCSSACSKEDTSIPEDNSGQSGSGAGTSGGSGSGSSMAGSMPSSGAGTGSPTAGSDAPSAGSGAEQGVCLNQGEINTECPFNLPPATGSCAPHGDCCHRASNIASVAALGDDDTAQIEFRLNYVDITNHPLSIGLPDLQRTAGQRAEMCSGEQCLLWRFTAPRSGGAFVAGTGEVEIGIGRYNCEGTFSFYGPDSAPDRTDEIGESDPGRWQSVKVPAEFDPAQTGRDRYHIPWAMNKNREIARSIFTNPMDNKLDWELASSGFDITEIDWSGDVLDCVGTRNGFVGWNTVSGFVAYSPIAGNDQDVAIQTNQTYCSLLQYGLLPADMKDVACDMPRCMPDGGQFGDGGCDWIKLPDSLCPETAEQRDLYGCHLGAEGNPNEEEGYPETLNCTPSEPTEPQNPDMGVTTTGQCCDPLGESTQLPACNAYRTVGKFVAAAAEITDEPKNGLPEICE